MGLTLLITIALSGADAPTPHLDACKNLVGQWRGVGQVRRGSTRGAWQVKGGWKWDFTSSPQLVYSATDGKYLQSAKIEADGDQLKLVVNGKTPFLQHPQDGGALVFRAKEPLENGLAQVSLRLVAKGDRLVMRLDRRTTGGRYSALGEVGFTRIGSGFGQGASYVECVVTGGLGTIPVTHQGKTYYVCCTGCKEYFEENPDEVLKEYRERKEEERQSRAKNKQDR